MNQSSGNTVENKELSWSGAYKSYVKRSFFIGRFKYILKKHVTEELIFSSDDLSSLRDKTIIIFLRTNSFIETAKQRDISIPELKKKILNAIESLGNVRSFYLTRKFVRPNKNGYKKEFKIHKIKVNECRKPLVDEFKCNIKGYQSKMNKFLNPLKQIIMILMLENGSYLKTAKILKITPKKVRNELVRIVELLKKVKKTSWITPS